MFKNENVEVKVVVGNSGKFDEMVVRYMKYCISIYRNTIEAILATNKERHFF